jgi:hypothetical protein
MTETDRTADTFDAWVVVHLFGRHTVAGKASEQKIAGKDFLRIDVPEVDGRQARTVLYSPDAVYDLEPVDEETARLAAKLHPPASPVSVWSAREMFRESGSQLALAASGEDLDDDDDDPEAPF